MNPKLIVLALFLASGVTYALLIPPGEAPDEPAHVTYVDHLLETGALPSLDGPFGYEAHQPPLDYLVSAGLLQLTVGRTVSYPFAPQPRFRYAPGTAPPLDAVAARRLRALRIARLSWGVVTIVALFGIGRLFSGREWAVATAVLPFALAPQFVFISASVNNDAAIVAVASVALLALSRAVRGGARPGAAWLAGAVAGTAMLAKASGIFLAVPVAVGVWLLRRRPGHVARLLVGYAAMGGLAVALQLARFGVLFPPLPRLPSAAFRSASNSLFDPGWVADTWGSFWARFGWLNLDLPAAGYMLFLPATLAVLLGAARYPTDGEGCRMRAVIDAGAVALLILYVTYLAVVDWQLQGRYLFPAFACGVAVLAPRMERVAMAWWLAIWLCSIGAVCLGAATILSAYR